MVGWESLLHSIDDGDQTKARGYGIDGTGKWETFVVPIYM